MDSLFLLKEHFIMKPKQIVFRGDSCSVDWHNGLRLHFWTDPDDAYDMEVCKLPFHKAKIKVIFEFPEEIDETPLVHYDWKTDKFMVRYDLIDKGEAVDINYD